MTQATHGWWCNSRTFPMPCKHCGDQIFYFSCDCGSRLFFDKLGYPWPQHRCRGFVQARTLSQLGVTDLSGSLASYIGRETASKLSKLIDDGIAPEYADSVMRAGSVVGESKALSSWIQKQDAYDGLETTEIGKVVELNFDVDIHKKAGILARNLGAARLAKFAEMSLAQITIHTGALGDDAEDNCSFTFILDANLVTRKQIIRGSVILASLRGIVINSKYPIWICDRVVNSQR